jgi:hypothetical protein
MSSDRYFVFYVMFDGSKVPIFCSGAEDDPYLKDYFLYKNVEKLSDSVFPDLKVDQISLAKEDVIYYVSGTKEEMIAEVESNKTQDHHIEKEDSKEIISEEKKEKPKRRRRRFSSGLDHSADKLSQE